MTPKEALNWLSSNKTWLNTNKVPEVVYEAIEKALNELERLKKFKETFDNYELVKKQDFIAYENWLECEKELEELKRDVARYFELANVGDVTKEVLGEFSKIRDKLMEVGKENE